MELTIKVAVVYHSGFGHTKKQAEAVRDGAAEVRGVDALVMDVTEAQQRWNDLEACEAIVFGAPTYMGSASAEFKAFQDATSRPVMAKGFAWSGKLAAASRILARAPGTSFRHLSNCRCLLLSTGCIG